MKRVKQLRTFLIPILVSFILAYLFVTHIKDSSTSKKDILSIGEELVNEDHN